MMSNLLLRIAYGLRLVDGVSIARKLGVTVGDRCRILSDPFQLFGTEPYLISIGNHVEITNGCRFVTHDGAVWCLREDSETSNIDYFAPIEIGDNVFIGTDSVVLPGVSIGENTIVGAGSVVSKSLPPNSVCAGVPCRVIRPMSEYRDSVVASASCIKTKGMTPRDKEKAIRDSHPEWFR